MLTESPVFVHEPSIHLTVTGQSGEYPAGSRIQVHTRQLVAYFQEHGFTRLLLTGSKNLNVKEGTDEIDRLVRTAATSV